MKRRSDTELLDLVGTVGTAVLRHGSQDFVRQSPHAQEVGAGPGMIEAATGLLCLDRCPGCLDPGDLIRPIDAQHELAAVVQYACEEGGISVGGAAPSARAMALATPAASMLRSLIAVRLAAISRDGCGVSMRPMVFWCSLAGREFNQFRSAVRSG